MYECCRMGRLALLLIALLACAGARAQAPATSDLYAAVVPVTEQSEAELRRGAGVGLREVLVRASGRSDAPQAQAVAGALGDAGRYLDQYRYERNTNAPAGAAPWLLYLRFAPNSVAQLLRGAGLPVWGGRPALQLWLATEDGGRRQFVGEQSPLAAPLRTQAWRRGLTLRFPTDPRAVPVDAVWQMDMAMLRGIPAAGGGAVAVFGRLALAPGGQCSATLTLPAGEPRPVDGDTLDTCFATGFDRIADALAQQYAAPATASGGDVTMRVSGVEDFNAYATLLAYMKQIAAIKSASPQRVEGGTVLLQLRLEGGAEQLARQLALDNRLVVEPAADAGPAAPLQYRWQAAPR